MSSELLLREFSRITKAPAAIEDLRQFVLDLAVRGKLVEQRPEEGTGAQLLERLLKASGSHVASRISTIGPAREEPREFQVPATWKWCYVRQIGKVVGGGTPPAADADNFVPGGTGIAWLTPADLGKRQVVEISYGARDLSPKGMSECSATLMPKGTVLFSSRAPIGYVAIAANPIATNQGFKSVVPYIVEMSAYISLYFRAFRLAIDAKASGTTFREVPGKVVAELSFPLPPLPEQQRIVARVDELMTLLNQLKAAQVECNCQKSNLRRAAFKALAAADPYQTVESADIRFVLQNFSRFITEPEHLREARQVIIDLAIRGQLLPPEVGDGTAEELLHQIDSERAAMLDKGFPNPAEARTQQKKQERQKLPSGLPKLPSGWKWATLMKCSAIVIDCRNKTAPYLSSGIVLLRTTNVRDGQIILGDHRYVSDETYEIWSSRYKPQPGDIVITREAPMGEVAKIPVGLTACLGQRLMLCRLVPGTIDADFLVYSLRDSNLMERVQDKPIGALVEHLRVGGVETLLVPVPPLSEQRRIVDKLDEVMAIYDELEIALGRAQVGRDRLLKRLLQGTLDEDAGSVCAS